MPAVGGWGRGGLWLVLHGVSGLKLFLWVFLTKWCYMSFLLKTIQYDVCLFNSLFCLYVISCNKVLIHLYRHTNTYFRFVGNRTILYIPFANVYVKYMKYGSIQKSKSNLHTVKLQIPFHYCIYHNDHKLNHNPDRNAVKSFN